MVIVVILVPVLTVFFLVTEGIARNMIIVRIKALRTLQRGQHHTKNRPPVSKATVNATAAAATATTTTLTTKVIKSTSRSSCPKQLPSCLGVSLIDLLCNPLSEKHRLPHLHASSQNDESDIATGEAVEDSLRSLGGSGTGLADLLGNWVCERRYCCLKAGRGCVARCQQVSLMHIAPHVNMSDVALLDTLSCCAMPETPVTVGLRLSGPMPGRTWTSSGLLL